MNLEDARTVLGISEHASISEIKKAYRRLAAQYHPDRHSRDPAQTIRAVKKMQRINTAYSVISANSRIHEQAFDETEVAQPPEKKARPAAVSRWWIIVLVASASILALLAYRHNNMPEPSANPEQKPPLTIDSFSSPPPVLFAVDSFNTIPAANRKKIQQHLIKLGYDLGQSDGVFGSKTMTAIHNFCRDFSFAADIQTVEGFMMQLDYFALLGEEFENLGNIVSSRSFLVWLQQQKNIDELVEHPQAAIELLDNYVFTAHSPDKQKLPPSTIVWRNDEAPTVRNFEITNSSAQAYYYKIVETGSDDELLYGFLRPFESSTITISDKACRIKLASGTTWYGKKYLFGPETELHSAVIMPERKYNHLLLDNNALTKLSAIKATARHNF
jgi:hypothetical protein